MFSIPEKQLQPLLWQQPQEEFPQHEDELRQPPQHEAECEQPQQLNELHIVVIHPW